MTTAIACIVAAAKSSSSNKEYNDVYAAKYKNISKYYYDKYAKKWVDKYGSKSTTLAPTTTEEITTQTPEPTETKPTQETPEASETKPTQKTPVPIKTKPTMETPDSTKTKLTRKTTIHTKTKPTKKTPEPTKTKPTQKTPETTKNKPTNEVHKTAKSRPTQGGPKSSTVKPTTKSRKTYKSEKPTQRSTYGYDYDKHTTNGHKTGAQLANLLKHFGVKDAAEVTWAHAVNSKAKHDKALSNEKIMMLEADVIMDQVREIPIMAHPPANSSDITLEEFLVHTLKHSEEKGIKLDFKQDEALNASVSIMKKLFEKRQKLPPIILNADILVGPNTNENDTSPVEAELFFSKLAPFKHVVLSPGWTTKYLGDNSTGYNNTDANEMTKLIQKYSVQQDLIFPMRASLLALNPKPAFILLNQMQAKTSIIVWTSKTDVYDPKKLGFLRLYPKKVFYDLPPKDVELIKKADYIPSGVIPDIGKKYMP